MRVAVTGFAVVDIDDTTLDQLVDDPTDPTAVERVLQAMVDKGDRSVIHGWERLAELQIDEVSW